MRLRALRDTHTHINHHIFSVFSVTSLMLEDELIIMQSSSFQTDSLSINASITRVSLRSCWSWRCKSIYFSQKHPHFNREKLNIRWCTRLALRSECVISISVTLQQFDGVGRDPEVGKSSFFLLWGFLWKQAHPSANTHTHTQSISGVVAVNALSRGRCPSPRWTVCVCALDLPVSRACVCSSGSQSLRCRSLLSPSSSSSVEINTRQPETFITQYKHTKKDIATL